MVEPLDKKLFELELERFELEPERFELEPERFQLEASRFELEPQRFELEPERFEVKASTEAANRPIAWNDGWDDFKAPPDDRRGRVYGARAPGAESTPSRSPSNV